MKIRGFELQIAPLRDSYIRRQVQLSNKIAQALSLLGVSSESVESSEEKFPLRPLKASVSWYIEGHYCHFSHSSQARYIDNLQVVTKIIELEVDLVVTGKKPLEQFIYDYSEKDDFEAERKKAREILEVPSDCTDFVVIDSQYKKLSKLAHPDMQTGDVDKFKLINWAHKTLKRELV